MWGVSHTIYLQDNTPEVTVVTVMQPEEGTPSGWGWLLRNGIQTAERHGISATDIGAGRYFFILLVVSIHRDIPQYLK
jgi:hypothetical protein